MSQMAAYAALISLMHIMDQILHNARHQFSLNKSQIESPHEKVTHLVDFLEFYPLGYIKEVEVLESRIADAAHAAEDLIESKVVDYIHDNEYNWFTRFEENVSNPLCQKLQEVIQVMDSIKKEVVKIKEKREIKVQLPKDPMPYSRLSSSLPASKSTMVGFDHVSIMIMHRLTGQQSGRRCLIPIVGMGGIGKTTLARHVYEHPVIVQYFDIRAWVTISQEYNMRKILLSFLRGIGVPTDERTKQSSDDQLCQQLYKHLFGRKYLIVLDDMWNINVWDKVKLFFSDNSNGSGVMITTRLTDVASQFGSCGIEMNFLDEDSSWNLLSGIVFGEEGNCLELEDIGKKIARKCKGLPLSIVVIGGLLAKSNKTREYWEDVAEEVNSIISLAEDGHCLKILSLSYKHLPVHLKPCFLYMGVFPEDHEIRVSRLIKLWVAQGFLKPNKDTSLEEIAEEYLSNLIDRNLIKIHKQGSSKERKTCKIHDLLRDLCLKEAQKEKFLCVMTEKFDIPPDFDSQRHLVIYPSTSEDEYFSSHLSVPSLARSVIGEFKWAQTWYPCRLLRVLNVASGYSLDDFSKLVNLQYLAFEVHWRYNTFFPSRIYLLWNLQTLIVRGTREGTVAPSEIWMMHQLRHLEFEVVSLPDPPRDIDMESRRFYRHFLPVFACRREDSILVNLKTLSNICNFICRQEVLVRIPNIKKLQIFYVDFSGDCKKRIDYCLRNLGHLDKLESLGCRFEYPPTWSDLLNNLVFPHSLKKLTLENSYIPWEHMTIIGSLQNLQVLKSKNNSFIGPEWNPVEGEFLCLKYLLIESCNDLEFWMAGNTHFPSLESLVLRSMYRLKEIPVEMGEIPTLRSIELKDCSDSVINSAKVILDEQESLGNIWIQLQIWQETQLESMTSDDFEPYYQY